MKTLKRQIKKPRPPRCFYSSFANFVFGIVSPSLYLNNFLTSTDPKVSEFFEKQKTYLLELLEQKINNRTATRQEYKSWKRGRSI